MIVSKATVITGQLHLPIDSLYAFKDVREAYARTLTGRARGKVVVRMDVDEELLPEVESSLTHESAYSIFKWISVSCLRYNSISAVR